MKRRIKLCGILLGVAMIVFAAKGTWFHNIIDENLKKKLN